MEQKITHHLTDDILMAYAAGTLPEAFNLMVATHVSLCDECRAVVESYDTLGGEVLDQTPGNDVALTPGSFAATMALIAGGPPEVIRTERRRDAVLPQPLQIVPLHSACRTKERPEK